MRYLLLSCLIYLANNVSAQFLDVVSAEQAPYNVPANLIRDHLTGNGIEILNVEYSGTPQAVGYFTGGMPSMGLERGLILTTGKAASQGAFFGAQDNGSDFANSNNAFDFVEPLLQALATGNMHDPVRFRITFKASSDSIRFRYVFASEEYPEFACTQFNDIFGFFLEGPGIPTPKNIAIVPGTNMPVSINNVHPLNNQNNPTPDPCFPFNESYYHNNLNSNAQPVYDGFLDVLTAEAAVQPCGVYVMTLVLTDIGDSAYDTAVFLEGNSFNGDVGISASFAPGEAILPENATADTVSITLSQIPPTLLPLTVQLGGMAENGLDYFTADSTAVITTTDTVLYFHIQPLPDTLQELVEDITITVRDSVCFFREFVIYLADSDTIFSALDSLVFNGDQQLTAPSSSVGKLQWSGTNNTVLPIGPVQTMVYSDLMVDGLGSPVLQTLVDPSILESICVNIQHPWLGDLALYLFAPNGQFIELSTDNGGNGDNYTNTCFTPSATQSIKYDMPFAPASAAPFTGNFKPEGSWNDLLGAPLEGIWRLGILDNQSGQVGQLFDWSLSFFGAALENFKYQWSTGDTTKTIHVSAEGTYSVTVSNAMGVLSKTFVLYTPCGVVDSITATIAAGETYHFGGQSLSEPGFYTQVFEAANGCDSVVVLHLQLFSAVTDPSANAMVVISPNPSNGETWVSWDHDTPIARVRVYDMNGKLISFQTPTVSSSFLLKTSDWVKGWYVIELENADGNLARGRVFVQ